MNERTSHIQSQVPGTQDSGVVDTERVTHPGVAAIFVCRDAEFVGSWPAVPKRHRGRATLAACVPVRSCGNWLPPGMPPRACRHAHSETPAVSPVLGRQATAHP